MRVLLVGAWSPALGAAHAQEFEWAFELERDYFIARDFIARDAMSPRLFGPENRLALAMGH